MLARSVNNNLLYRDDYQVVLKMMEEREFTPTRSTTATADLAEHAAAVADTTASSATASRVAAGLRGVPAGAKANMYSKPAHGLYGNMVFERNCGLLDRSIFRAGSTAAGSVASCGFGDTAPGSLGSVEGSTAHSFKKFVI